MGNPVARLRAVDPLLLLAIALSAALFTFIYLIDPNRPGIATPEGWFGFADQGQYLAMAKALSSFGMDQPTFMYGPGYPVFAVPFLWMGLDYDPFVIVNGLALVATITMTFIVGQRLGGRLVGAIAAFGLLFATPLVAFTTQPWNSTISVLALLVVLIVATNERIELWSAALLGLAPGAAFAARYVDGIFIGAVALAVVISRHRELGRRGIAVAIGVGAVPVLLVLWMQWAVLGSPFTTPYASHGRGDGTGPTDADLGAYDLLGAPRSFFGMFISPYLLGGKSGGASMLQSAFWFILAIPGAWLAGRRGSPRRAVVLTAAVASVAAIVFYTSFHGAGAGSVQFGSLHYFKAWWPLWAILSALAIARIGRIAWRRPTSSSGAPAGEQGSD